MILCSHPKVVILIGAYNEGRYIEKTLNSLLCQSYSDFKVLISDNCSSDETYQICKGYAERDERFVLHRQKKNIGGSKNWEFVITSSDSEYFMVLGAHDYLSCDYVSTQVKLMDQNPEYVLSYSYTQQINEDGDEIGVSDGGQFHCDDLIPIRRYVKTAVGRWGECTAVCGLFRRSAFEGMKYYNIAGPDHFILTRAQYFGKVNRVEQPIYFRRYFESRPEDYMTRITGKSSRDNKRNLYPLFFYQILDYLQLPEPVYVKARYFPFLFDGMSRTYGLFYYALLYRLWSLLPSSLRCRIKTLC